MFVLGDEILPIIDGDKDFSSCMMKIYDYFSSHRMMMLNLYRHIELEEINNRLRPYVEDVAANMVDEVTADYPLKAADRKIAVKFTVLMISEFLMRWIAMGAPEQKERFSRFADLLECNMKSTIRFLHEGA